MSPNADAEPLPFAPAPWLFEGEGWVIPTYTPFSETPIPLPKGSYAPFEQGTTVDMSDRFHGGVGLILILRYSHTDVGPYDELILIPGLFSNQHKGADKPTYDLAITRIVVSSDRSTINGRREWGMPKHRGIFTFSALPSSSASTQITVAHPTSPTTPYFRTVLRDSWATPLSLPVSTAWLSLRMLSPLMVGYAPTLVQRPLPAPNEDEAAELQRTGQRTEAFVPCPAPLRVNFAATGRVRLAVVHPAPAPAAAAAAAEGKGEEESAWDEFGDGNGFPRVKPYTRGGNFHFTRFRMDLGKGVEVELQ